MSKTLIDSILFSENNKAATSENLITDILDYHTQFLITSKIFKNDANEVTLRRSFKIFNNDLFPKQSIKY